MEKNVADKINYLSKNNGNEIENLRGKVTDYANKLKASGLKDENLARKLDWGFLRYLAVITGFPLFVAGFLSNLLPFIVPRVICNRLIKDPRFYSSVYISSGTLLYLIYFPVLLILAGIFAGWTGFLLGLLVPLLGYLVLFYQEIVVERFNTLRYNIKSVSNRSLVNDLKIRRKEIESILDSVRLN
jgi:hypothetical protein